MLVIPMWAMVLQLFFGNGSGESWLASGHWLLVGVGITTIALEVWMLIEALIMFPKVKGVLERSPDNVVPQAATESS